MAKNRLFTSESVTEGHPDKICDQISDAILDAILEKDPDALTRDDLSYIGTYALMAASLSTERSGGIPSIPEKEAVQSKL